MGKVVKLEPAKKQRAKPAGKRRPRRSKTALVLGGGGFTGGVYEIGALRALDLLSVNRTVNQFDVYVGTSAGSFVAALTANGVTPEEMMRVVNQQVPTPFRDVDLGSLLQPNVAEFAKSAALLPLRSLDALRTLVTQRGQVSAMDLVLGLAEGLPSGALLGHGHRALHAHGALRPRPHGRLPQPRARAVPDRDRPGHVRADRLRRRGLGRRPDLHRRACLDRAAHGLQARRRPRPRADRRRHRLDHEPRHRRRGGGEVRRRRQPARALRQRLQDEDPHHGRARGRATSATWGSPRSATRSSSCWPTSACTRWRASGSNATRAWTSSSSSPSPTTS